MDCEIRKVAPGKWFAGVTDASSDKQAREVALGLARKQTTWPLDITLHHRDSRDGHLTCWFDVDETVMP